jgi:recombination protein RecA
MKKKKDTNDRKDLFASIAKKTGGSLFSDGGNVKYTIDTGSLALNYICSGKFINGGIAGGKITEIYGPESSAKSLVSYSLLGSCQRMSGIPIYLDCEFAGNADFAEKCGHLNPDELFTYHPETYERIEKKIISSVKEVRENFGPDVPILIVWDSIGVTMTERECAEIDLPENASKTAIKEAGGNERPGERAKAAGKAFRKLNPFLDEHNATLVVINQTRANIGVMYGECFSYNTKVMLSDGSFEKIGKIVNQKIPLDVMSLNLNTGKVESKKIIGWHNNGHLNENEKFIKIRFRRNFSNTDGCFICTPNHMIIKNGKEIAANELKQGDMISVNQPYYLNEDQKQVVYGSLLGDGNLRCRTYGNTTLRICHGINQKEYCQWKESIFNNIFGSHSEDENRYYFETKPILELTEFKDYKIGKKPRLSYQILDEISSNLNELGLAIWYMDDGTYGGHHEKWGSGKSSIYCIKYKDKEKMLPFFHKYDLHPTITDKAFVFNAVDTLKLHQLICRFVPPSMSYKIHPKFRDLFDYEIKIDSPVYKSVENEIVSIVNNYHSTLRSKNKFDLTIEDNSTYCVGGAFVHNSDVTAGGGRALKYYASCRLAFASSKQIKDEKKDIVIGVNLLMRNKKNRHFPPHRNTKGVQLYFDQGINPLGGMLSILIGAGRIEASGKGTYKVMEPWADGQDYTFKASMERNDVPMDLLLKYPKIIDANDADEVREYLQVYDTAISINNSDNLTEISTNEEALLEEVLDAEGDD